MSFATWYNSRAKEGWAYNDPSQELWQIDLGVLALSLGRADRQRHERQSKEAALFVAPAVFLAGEEGQKRCGEAHRVHRSGMA